MKGFHLAACLLALSAPIPAMGADTDWGLPSLMASLSQVKSASARFVEHKSVQMLTRPLEATGTLTYVAPRTMEKKTLSPAPESIELRGDMLSGLRSNGDRYSVDLNEHPEVAALVEGIRSTLAGDLPTLERYYIVRLLGTRGAWQLLLTPRDESVRDKVDVIRIVGAGTALAEVDIHEIDGDHSEMIVTPDAS
ncbi:MAG TPA: LolA-related protein [Aliidongia sp.]|nr:LolA-related protein [Aliidongia sp.]